MDTGQRMSFLLYLQGLVIADYSEKGHEPGTALADVDEFVNWYYDAGYKAGHDAGYVAGHRDGELGLML